MQKEFKTFFNQHQPGRETGRINYLANLLLVNRVNLNIELLLIVVITMMGKIDWRG
jgi:hypothetical protein